MHCPSAGGSVIGDAKLAHWRMLRAFHAHLTQRAVPSGSVVPAMPRYAHCLVDCGLGGALRRAVSNTVADMACCGRVAGVARGDSRCLAPTAGGRGAVAIGSVFFAPGPAVTAGRGRF